MGTNSRNVAARTRGRNATGLPRHRGLLAVAATLAFVSAIAVAPNRAASQAQVGAGRMGPSISLATYLGSELADRIIDIETDASGNVFVFGTVPDAATSIPFAVTPFFDTQPLAN